MTRPAHEGVRRSEAGIQMVDAFFQVGGHGDQPLFWSLRPRMSERELSPRSNERREPQTERKLRIAHLNRVILPGLEIDG